MADRGRIRQRFIEAGISEDDPRNPAVIADNVGDNVGDVAGLGVDLLESYVEAIIASMAIAEIAAYEVADVYGVAMAALGMLAATGMVVAVDSYGHVADNAGGIAEMANLEPQVRSITDNLDAVGNTTAAIGKGFAIGSAAFAALGLLVAYIETAKIRWLIQGVQWITRKNILKIIISEVRVRKLIKLP